MLSTLLSRLRRVESKLPLSIVVLLLGAVAAVSFVAYREVVRATVESTNQRLGIVSWQLVTFLEESLAERMRHLIDALLELSRAGRQELVLAEVDLTGLARQVAGELEGASPGREVEWRIADGLVARGDRQLVGVVLRNLLGNAWKFTARNRERALIELAPWKNEPDTYFVRDNGAGFDMEFAGQIFGPFRRLHAESEFSGTGIGLSIVQRVVERHRGKVWAEGAVGAGAAFYF